MSRLCRVLLAVAIAAAATAPPAAAVSKKELSRTLGALWTTVIQTPAADNPFTGGDPCIELGRSVLAPFAGPPEFTCTVKPGTRIFVVGWSSECSTIEEPPYHGDDEASLRDCARAVDAGLTTPTVTLDGNPVAVAEVETALLEFVLPPGHIFDPALAAGTPGQSVGHGWVALLHPLTPGSHVIHIEVRGMYLGAPFESVNTTTIEVR
jgi:hypothetical protein